MRKMRSRSEKIVFAAVFCIFFLYAAFILYFLFYAFNASLIENGRAFVKNNTSLRFFDHPEFANFYRAFTELKDEYSDTGFFGMTVNSLWFAGGSVVLSIFFTTATAYVVCKYDFRLKNFIYKLAIIMMMLPVYGTLPATYRMFSRLHMIDSPLILLSATGGLGFNFIIIYAFFKELSWNYAEAAFIDGAGNYDVFFRIMLPMVMPSVSAIAIISFVGSWNNYEGPILYLRTMPTLASGLWQYERKIQYEANQPVYFAGVILSLIPVMTIFAVFQNTIMQNIYAGGLKG